MMGQRTIVVGLAAGAVAVLGLGVIGSQADPALQPNVTCTSTSACTSTTNNGKGPATAATSVGGTGSTSTTKFSSTGPTKFSVGLLGVDASASGVYDAGVEGKSVRGLGLFGVTTSGTGVYGTSSSSGTGVSGTSNTGTGVYGASSSIGMEAQSSGNGGVGLEAIASASAANGTAILSYANGSGGVGVSANGDTYGLQAFAGNSAGTAVAATGSGANLFTGTTNGTQVFSVNQLGNVTANYVVGQGGQFITSAASPIFAWAEDTTGSDESADLVTYSDDLLSGTNEDTFTQVLRIDASGNIYTNGLIYTAGGCSSGCLKRGPDQRRVASYSQQVAQPSMEDDGEAQLVNGDARVSLDPSYANVIDTTRDYLVFVTPEGDCNGLYIAGKSRAGFEVRELRGGHSSLAFEYRIVARPYGVNAARLPMIQVARRATLPKMPLRHRAP